MRIVQNRRSRSRIRFADVAYHWTTREAAPRIAAEGLLPGSYVCRTPRHWYGKVCFEITVADIVWSEGPWNWQRRLFSGSHKSAVRRMTPAEVARWDKKAHRKLCGY
jgi:hypothetical protein